MTQAPQTAANGFPMHDLDSAPDASKPLLEKSQKAFGRLPGLHRVMSESPQHLEAYQTLHRLFTETAFDADEMTVVWQTINVEHECHYCVPAHTGIAKAMKVDDAIVQALRDETPLPSAKLEALRTFTLQMLRQRGDVTGAQMQAFLDAGYGHRAVLDVVLGLAQKVMSNYMNHVAETPLDAPVQPLAWTRKGPPIAA
ncbi:carboxymuconolactone decarboxylase family protein [Jannaschia sp. Os4]|uniref:carboxymuconolactone decarboxylase family protein n=1 Tax=Jannaschia sp. Os4 TaxID=2807617 RepID=UPI001939FCB0|nr:carboxymuconolactone decarboxylase family protein [Jannaschia sp. Os4]MBM2577500.1 carboxymuconolactone decarboxylase family protein [Jannaschia sp. Os4]